MELIEKQLAVDAIDRLRRGYEEVVHVEGLNSEITKLRKGYWELTAAIGEIKGLPPVRSTPVWHECFDDDPNSFPDDSRNVLVSFSNFSLSIIGQWRVDEGGAGCWYLGDTDETFLSEDLYVDGWWELPKKPERSN